jgi:hypothetical protein
MTQIGAEKQPFANHPGHQGAEKSRCCLILCKFELRARPSASIEPDRLDETVLPDR